MVIPAKTNERIRMKVGTYTGNDTTYNHSYWEVNPNIELTFIDLK